MDDVRYIFDKVDPNDVIWCVSTDPPMKGGSPLFSFDKKKVYSFWRDYPNNLTAGEKAIFDAEYPEWKKYYETGSFE